MIQAKHTHSCPLLQILLPAPDEHKKKCTQHKAQLSVWESVFAAPRWALRV